MDLIIIRFPDGSREFRYPPRDLEEGDRVWHDGKPYRVLAVFSDDGRPPIVTVELDSDDIGDLLGSERGGIELVPID
jgi:hypothetical protein